MMFEIGDFVSKPVTGVCKIEDILYLDPQGKKENKLYYLMRPVGDEREKIYVSVTNAGSGLRPVHDKGECVGIDRKDPRRSRRPWVENEKMREQKYKEAVKYGLR